MLNVGYNAGASAHPAAALPGAQYGNAAGQAGQSNWNYNYYGLFNTKKKLTLVRKNKTQNAFVCLLLKEA